MQQLQQPNLKPPLQLTFDEQRLHAEIQAMTQHLNQKMNDNGIKAEGRQRDGRVGILLEAVTLPPEQQLLSWLHQEVKTLNLKQITRIEVFTRTNGQQLQWRGTLDLKPELDRMVPLSEWLTQGTVLPSDQNEILTDQTVSTEEIAAQTQFLRFYFTAHETAVMPLEGIKEILKVPREAILPVPRMPSSVLGVYNCRGEILWLVDLGIQIGLGNSLSSYSGSSNSSSLAFGQPDSSLRPTRSRQILTTIVIEAGYQAMGLVVPEVLDIESHPLQQIQPAPPNLFSPQLLPFIQTYLPHSRSPVLNLTALIDDPKLQIHR